MLTYGRSLYEAFYKTPAKQIALVYRVRMQSSGITRTGTLLEDELIAKMNREAEKYGR